MQAGSEAMPIQMTPDPRAAPLQSAACTLGLCLSPLCPTCCSHEWMSCSAIHRHALLPIMVKLLQLLSPVQHCRACTSVDHQHVHSAARRSSQTRLTCKYSSTTVATSKVRLQHACVWRWCSILWQSPEHLPAAWHPWPASQP